MSGRYLLDANIIIALFAQETAVHERLTTAEEVFVPCVAVGELYFGAYKSLRVPENLSRIVVWILRAFHIGRTWRADRHIEHAVATERDA